MVEGILINRDPHQHNFTIELCPTASQSCAIADSVALCRDELAPTLDQLASAMVSPTRLRRTLLLSSGPERALRSEKEPQANTRRAGALAATCKHNCVRCAYKYEYWRCAVSALSARPMWFQIMCKPIGASIRCSGPICAPSPAMQLWRDCSRRRAVLARCQAAPEERPCAAACISRAGIGARPQSSAVATNHSTSATISMRAFAHHPAAEADPHLAAETGVAVAARGILGRKRLAIARLTRVGLGSLSRLAHELHMAHCWASACGRLH